MKELLYSRDRFPNFNNHVIHVTFPIEWFEVKSWSINWNHENAKKTREIKMIPVDDLNKYGFSQTFYRLAKDNFFSSAAVIKGDFHMFYVEAFAECPGRVVMRTALASSRITDMLPGDLLSRIC